MHFHTPQVPCYAGLETQVREQLFRVNIQCKTTVIIPLCHYIVSYFTKINKWDIYERFATNLMALSNHNKGFIFVFMSCYCVNMQKYFSRKCQRCERFGPIIHLGSVLFVAISGINRTLLYYMKTYIDIY